MANLEGFGKGMELGDNPEGIKEGPFYSESNEDKLSDDLFNFITKLSTLKEKLHHLNEIELVNYAIEMCFYNKDNNYKNFDYEKFQKNYQKLQQLDFEGKDLVLEVYKFTSERIIRERSSDFAQAKKELIDLIITVTFPSLLPNAKDLIRSTLEKKAYQN